MTQILETLQLAEFVTTPEGQPVVQFSLSAWETLQNAIHASAQADETENDLMMKLFLDFAMTDTLHNQTLQPYTIAMSETAHHLIEGVVLDDDATR